jgi:hypothetical protein
LSTDDENLTPKRQDGQDRQSLGDVVRVAIPVHPSLVAKWGTSGFAFGCASSPAGHPSPDPIESRLV